MAQYTPLTQSHLRVLLATLSLAAGTAAAVQADTLNLGAAADNTMYGEDGNQSNGAGNSFFVGRTSNGELRRGLVRFDLSAIPPSSTITAVTLTLYCSRTRAPDETINLHRLSASWGEGASNASGGEGGGAAATTGDATWTYRFYNTTAWTTPGGQFVSTPSASLTVSNQNRYYAWSSAGLVADVQSWVNSSAVNFGWILIGNESGTQTTKRFESRQSTTPSYRPALAITYTPPVTTTGACCLSNGSCQVATQASCAGLGGTYQGDNTVCTPNPCPQPTGACCFNNGSCAMLTQAQCSGQSGTYQGNGVACTSGLCPVLLTPFVDPLPIPAIAQPVSGAPGGTASYEIPIRQVQQRLHRDLPLTTVWGYGGTYPGPTIVASVDHPVTVTWINDLRDELGNLRTTHYMPVDLCIMGAENVAKVVTHLHGGHVPQNSDGYPEDAFLPGFSDTYVYPNRQLPGTLWYHDHALGVTRLNVMMGLAGFYLLFDDFETALNLPSGPYEIGLAIQDRTFNSDGSIRYPALWEEHYFGDKILVNGKVWPYLNVARGKYRFRMLGGSTSRTYTLSLSNGAPMTQIGTEGGMLPAPLIMPSITLGPGERADVIIDFESYSAGTEILLLNSAPAPYPSGDPMHDVPNVMKFIVQSQMGHTAPVPGSLRPLSLLNPVEASATRNFELRKSTDACTGSMWMINGLRWTDVTEYPTLGTSEIWRFINRSGVSHPMHMHLVMFQVIDRQNFTVVNDQIVPVGDPIPPPANEAGWKDTVMCHPSQITRVICRFENYTGRYPYHCHILEHEEHEMMRQFDAKCRKGDTNQDTLVDARDITLFVEELVAGPNPGTAAYCATDMDDNGALNLATDVPPFVDCLLQEVCP